MELPEEPAVLVLLVVTDGARWLPETLRSLRAQKHRPIEVVAIDNASTDGSLELVQKALGVKRTVRLERRVGYGRALAAGLKFASERGARADAFLLLHDDCALGPHAIEALLDAMRRDKVGIVGAKLLEWNDPSQLQDIGRTTDRYGRDVPRVERGEIDQGQHDGIHEVLFATSAALLIARPVVETVGLFDLRSVALRDDLDLCWRARLAGFTTVVTTDATARHASATTRDLRTSPVQGRVRYFSERNAIATVIKDYDGGHLALVLPATIVLALLNAVIYLVTGRRRSALQILEAFQWNVVHLGSTLRARYRAQHVRTIPDTEITPLMHHGATRLRSQIEGALERVVGEVEEGSDEDLDKPAPSIAARLRAHPAALMAIVGIVVMLVGARTIMFAAHLAGRDLAPFPVSGGELWRSFASGWRGAGAGGAGPATPGLVLLGFLQFVCFGSGWLVERVLVLGLPILGAISMWRLARALDMSGAARRVAVVAYIASPLMLGTFGAGRFPDLVMLAAAPALLSPLLRAAGVAPSRAWRDLPRAVLLLTIVAAVSPWALAFVLGAALLLGVFTAGTPDVARRVTVRGFATVGGALVLLFPWSVELFRAHSAIAWGGADPIVRVRDLVTLAVAAVRPLPLFLRYALPVAALAGLTGALADRRRIATLLGALSFGGLVLAWAVTRGVPWIAPRPALPLMLTAVGVAILAGFGWEAAAATLHGQRFGRVHLLAALVGLLVAAQLVASLGWIAIGRFPGLVQSGTLSPAFFPDEAAAHGDFRIAWIGGTARAPTVALSDQDGTTMRSFLARPAGAGEDAFEGIVAQIAGGATSAGGKLLATLGVRYVVVRPGADAALSAAVARQSDLAFSQRFHGAAVYEDDAGLPIAGAAPRGWALASRRALGAAATAGPTGAKPAGFARRSPDALDGKVSARGVILLAEDFSPAWRLEVGGVAVKPRVSFGWATAFDVSTKGTATVRWTGGGTHRLALILELFLVLAFGAWWSQRAARERGER